MTTITATPGVNAKGATGGVAEADQVLGVSIHTPAKGATSQ